MIRWCDRHERAVDETYGCEGCNREVDYRAHCDEKHGGCISPECQTCKYLSREWDTATCLVCRKDFLPDTVLLDGLCRACRGDS